MHIIYITPTTVIIFNQHMFKACSFRLIGYHFQNIREMYHQMSKSHLQNSKVPKLSLQIFLNYASRFVLSITVLKTSPYVLYVKTR